MLDKGSHIAEAIVERDRCGPNHIGFTPIRLKTSRIELLLDHFAGETRVVGAERKLAASFGWGKDLE